MGRIRLAASFRIIKYAMFLFNFLFWIFGTVIFVLGIYIRSGSSLISILESSYSGSYLFIFTGFIMMVMGFLGCCGALKENQCMLILFFIALFIIFILLMAAALWAIAFKGRLNKEIEKIISKKVAAYDRNSASPDDRKLIDDFQKNMRCCGVFGPGDYLNNYPESCGEKSIQRPGCHTVMVDFFEKNSNIIIAIGVVTALIMLVGMIFSILLCCAIKETKKLANQ